MSIKTTLHDAEPIIDLDSTEFAVVDLETGTVLGTNVVLVPLPKNETEKESFGEDEEKTISYALENGVALFGFQSEIPR